MLKSMVLKKFTTFSDVELEFGNALNVIVGENGYGKSHILKAAYTVCAVSSEAGKKTTFASKSHLQSRIAEKLMGVFRPDTLGRLTQRKQGRERSDVSVHFSDSELDIAFSFASNSKSEVTVETMPTKFLDIVPAFFPTRELLTLYPNFVAMYEGHYLEFEETWRDLCILLGQPAQKGVKEVRARKLLAPLERAMGGEVVLDKTGRFYLKKPGFGEFEMPLVAEGVRKFAMVARLISTGVLLEKGVLFWDEPEANLNPKLIKDIAQTIVDVARSGVQLVIATHSLFLLREFEIILAQKPFSEGAVRFFGFFEDESAAVTVLQGNTIEDIGDLTVLTEDLEQSDR